MISDFFATLCTVAQYAAITIMTAAITFMMPLCCGAIVTASLHAVAGKTDADNTPVSNLCNLAAKFVGFVVFIATVITVFRWFPFV